MSPGSKKRIPDELDIKLFRFQMSCLDPPLQAQQLRKPRFRKDDVSLSWLSPHDVTTSPLPLVLDIRSCKRNSRYVPRASGPARVWTISRFLSGMRHEGHLLWDMNDCWRHTSQYRCPHLVTTGGLGSKQIGHSILSSLGCSRSDDAYGVTGIPPLEKCCSTVTPGARKGNCLVELLQRDPNRVLMVLFGPLYPLRFASSMASRGGAFFNEYVSSGCFRLCAFI
jgi:hypothetical protein